MQAEVGWDPISVEYRPPWESKLFLLYLLLLFVIVGVRSLKIAGQLYSLSTNNRRERLKKSVGAERATLLAQFALASNFFSVVEIQRLGMSDIGLQTQAEAAFLFLFDVVSARIRSLMRLGTLTALLAGAVFALRATEALITTSNLKLSIAGASGGLAEAFSLLSMGLLASAVVYAAYLWFEGALQKRKLLWNRIWRAASESFNAQEQR